MDQSVRYRRIVARWSVICAIALVGLPATLVRADSGAVVEPGITRPYQEIELRFKYQGLVKDVKVEEGDVVTKDQVLMVQDDVEETLERDALAMEANSDITVLAAKANLEEKKLELAKVKQIHDGGAQNDLELAKAQTDVQVAELQVAKEQQDLNVKKLKVRKQQELLNKMKLVSLGNGVVQSVGAHPGELVDPAKPPVVVIVQNDPLLVEVQLPPTAGKNLKIDRVLRVSYDRKAWKEAKVYYLAPKADAASGLQTVKLRLPNPEGTASGAQIFVEIPADVAEGGRDAAAAAK